MISLTPVPQAQYKTSIITNRIIIKYIHQESDILLYIRPGDTPDATLCRVDRRVGPEGLYKLFGYSCLRNYYDTITESKYGDITIIFLPPPTLGDFTTTPKIPNGKPITFPTKFIQYYHLDIWYGGCVALGGHCYILTLINRYTRYVWTYGKREISGAYVIQYLQEFRLDAVRLPSKFYTYFENRIIQEASRKWLLDNGSKIGAAPAGRQSQNVLVEIKFIILEIRFSYFTDK